VQTELIEKGAFANAGNAGDSDTARLARVRENSIEDLCREFDVRRQIAFDDSDGACESGAVAGENPCDVLVNG